ncbi:NAD(P)-binding domain-containing protein [Panacibacter sp. DH6]|uniref:Glycerol-3-phosphate dehydrogenase [NAD(P)+] n=1 Tax=Panacibacter microcysteis TaxID=2793269 RepID=A0A931E5N4_9BACT|nr:NAD(P)H-dependent glycerol-3-phosphate dehydrogenase [Panacibacter microcysteis]MBG9375966.1 NAD(P)-binding domain-containing protein [Panacibacter microcysteis]
MQFGIIGSGSWATALAKILTDNNNHIYWWIRNDETISYLQQRRHNPHYLHNARFDNSKMQLSSNLNYIIEQSDVLVVAVPSAYIHSVFSTLNTDVFGQRKIVSAIKGLLPGTNQLFNEYLQQQFNTRLEDYFAIVGPCHAEEVAAEKLSYLTFSGVDEAAAKVIAGHFNNEYLNTIVNHDIMGVQYASVLKNIYALGAGIAHGLEYGDNFLSVYIANAASEMVRFVRKMRIDEDGTGLNYAASAYLGDLLVTCYSLYSRNRMFGNMIGKGYSVKAAQLELNMVAEGYNASRSIYRAATAMNIDIPIAATIYNILWEHVPASSGFEHIETLLV